MHGVHGSLGGILNTLVTPYGYKSIHSAIFGAVFTLFGLVGSFLASFYLDKYAKYQLVLRIISVGTFVSGAFLIFTFPLGNVYLVCLNISALGFFLIPVLPVGYSFASEITYPASEVMSNGNMMLVAELIGSGLTTLLSNVSISHPKSLTPFLVGVLFPPLLTSFYVKEDLRRLNQGKRGPENEEYEMKKYANINEDI